MNHRKYIQQKITRNVDDYEIKQILPLSRVL